MRSASLLVSLVLLVGCRADLKSKVVGNWRVDPASVTTTRLLSGSETRRDWTDATRTLGEISVEFDSDGSVSSTFQGATSKAKWSLNGDIIEIKESREPWPAMVYDSRGPRIHMTMERDEGRLQMDLTR